MTYHDMHCLPFYQYFSNHRMHVIKFSKLVVNRGYYMGFSLSPDLSARDSNIGPRACMRSDIGLRLIR